MSAEIDCQINNCCSTPKSSIPIYCEQKCGINNVEKNGVKSKVHKIRLGVCCMDKKLKSERHKNILSRIMAYGDIEVIPFSDDVMLNRV